MCACFCDGDYRDENPYGMKELLRMNKRDLIGCACWFAVGAVAGLWALPVMMAREIWQWKRYKLERLEWWDLVRYGAVIGLGSWLAA